MSSDSLGLDPLEEDTADEDSQTRGHLMRGSSREENPAISHLEDSFVPAETETTKDLPTDKSEELPELSMVTCYCIPNCFWFLKEGALDYRAVIALFSLNHSLLLIKEYYANCKWLNFVSGCQIDNQE